MTDDAPKSAITRAGESWTDERADEMRALSDEDRMNAIEASENVVGFDRFKQKAKQVALRENYRRPQKPA